METFLKQIEKIHTLYFATFLFLLTFFVYGNTLFNGLFFDDQDFIYDNTYVKTFAIDKFFTENAIAGAGKISNYYRPLQETTYAVEYALFKDMSFIYHFDNIFLHAIAGILLFIFIKNLTKNNFVALVTSLLFIIHPHQTEAVAYASGRNDSMYVIFTLLTFLFYLKKERKFYLLSLFTYLLALLSKEAALMVPGLIVLIDYFKTQSIKKTLLGYKQFIFYFVIAGLYFLLRLTVLNFQDTLNFYGTGTIYTTNVFVRILTFLSLLPTYMHIIFYPDVLYIDRLATIVTDPINMNVLMSIVGIGILLFFCIKSFRKYPIFLFCFSWFFITIVPVSGIIPINGLLYEHFLYFPSIGIFLAIAYLLFLLIGKTKSVAVLSIIYLCLCCLFLILITRTMIRNTEWYDAITFYNQTISHNPTSARLHNNLAMALADKGNNTKAIVEYKKAIYLSDLYPQTHYNLANTYITVNDYKNAEKEYVLSLEMDPTFYRSYLHLADLFKTTNQPDKLSNLIKKLEMLTQKYPNFREILKIIKQT